VSELRRREQELLTKDATIREIHHRVKNNLQTVAALLRLQARRVTDDAARASLEEAVRRVGTIAPVPEKLSQGFGDASLAAEVSYAPAQDNLGGLDNIWVLAVVYMSINLAITVWMMRSFFLEVPFEIVEAARVDGAGLFREIVRVVLPIVLPGVAAAALICFIFSWNEYFLATLLTSNVARTTPPFLGSFVDGRGQFLAVLSAAATLAVLPVIAAGWIAQKQLVRGLSMGAVK